MSDILLLLLIDELDIKSDRVMNHWSCAEGYMSKQSGDLKEYWNAVNRVVLTKCGTAGDRITVCDKHLVDTDGSGKHNR